MERPDKHISTERPTKVVDERFRKEDVTPVWYKRSSYLFVLAIIAIIVVVLAYDILFPVVPGPQPYVQPNP